MSQDVPGANREVRATALMGLECAVLAGHYAGALEREGVFGTEFEGTEEALLAGYWMALARHRTGQYQAAAALLESLVTANLDTGTRFRMVELQA